MRWTEYMVNRTLSRGMIPRRQKPADLEHGEQVALFDWATLNERRFPELARLFAVPNGGYRDKRTAAKLKAEGVKPGVPDVALPAARAGYHGLYVEMKVGKNKPTEIQSAWHADLENAGYACYVCYGWESAARVIVAYLEGRPVCGRTQK